MAALKYQVEGGDAGVTDEHVGIEQNWRLPGNRKADPFFRHERNCLRPSATNSDPGREIDRFPDIGW